MLLKIEQEMRCVTKNSKDSVISREFSIFSSLTETWRRWHFLLEIGEADLLKKPPSESQELNLTSRSNTIVVLEMCKIKTIVRKIDVPCIPKF